MNNYKECGDCVYKKVEKNKTSPCDSCERRSPSNFTEEIPEEYEYDNGEIIQYGKMRSQE